jgi:uncharacterized membrane protein (UPF0127 family)
MKLAENQIEKAIGLMFASEQKIALGMCFVNKKEVKTGLTTVFCMHPLEIIFVNKNNTVVDKVQLQPWKLNYVPKKPYKYAIESSKNKFKNIKISDRVSII